MKAPFPYYGGKSRVADDVWRRFGDVKVYVEPFCGSLAMLLARPHDTTTAFEVINDYDGHVINVWRAIQADPDAVAFWARGPTSEIDMQARHNFMFDRVDQTNERMRNDPEYYDPQIAGYWLYFKCAVIGGRGALLERFGSRIPELTNCRGIFSLGLRDDICVNLRELSARIRHLSIACGDWQRVLGPSTIGKKSSTGIFLDPPYDGAGEEWDDDVYTKTGAGVFQDVLAWCNANGDDPAFRIALCGYEGIEAPAGWSVFEWQATGGMSALAKGDSRSKDNKHRERIWFSPHCVSDAQFQLF